MTKVKRNTWFQKLKNFFLFLFDIFLIVFFILLIGQKALEDKIARENGIGYINSKFGTQISAENILIDWKNNVVFNKVIIKDHKNLDFIVADKLIVDISLIDLLKILYNKNWQFHELKLRNITLEKPVIKAITYKNEDKDNFTIFINKFNTPGPKSKIPFYFESDININNGQLSIVNQNTLENSIWLDAKELNVEAKKLKVLGSNFETKINKFVFKTKRNKEDYEVKQFSSDFVYTNKLLSFKSLIFETQSSILLGDAVFNYTNIDDFKDFDNKVFWDFNVKENSILSGKDIRYFNTKWDTSSNVKIASNINGTLNDLNLKDFKISNNQLFIQAQNINLHNIRQANFSIDLDKLNTNFTENGIKSILPTFLSKKLNNKLLPFKTIDYKGNITLNPKVITVNGNFISSLGFLNLKGKLSDYNEKIPRYEGNIKAKNANLFPLTHSNTLGTFTGNIDIEGQGFTENTISTKLIANFQSIKLGNFNFNQLNIAGLFSQKIFKGNLKTNDANAKFNADGIFNLQNPNQYKLNVLADVKYINLSHFGLAKLNPTIFSGKIDADIQFKTIENLTGKLKFTEAIYQTSKQAIAIEELFIDTQIVNKTRELYINSPNLVNGNLKGNYKLDDLPTMLQNGLGNLLVGYKPKGNFNNKNIAFDFKIEDDFINLFVPELTLDRGTVLHGFYEGNGNNLELIINTPSLYYDKLHALNVDININTKNPTNQLNTQISELYYDKQQISDIDVSAYKKNDSLFSKLKFKLGKEKSQIFDINLFQIRNKKLVEVGFLNSNILINNIDWKLNPENNQVTNKVTYNIKTKEFKFNTIELQTGESSIIANGNYLNSKSFNFGALIKDVRLEKFIPKEVLGDISIKGLFNGNVNIKKEGENIEPNLDLKVDDLEINDFLLGQLNGLVNYDAINGLFNVDSNIIKENAKNLILTGTIDNKKEKPELNINAHFEDFKMGVIGNFLKKAFSNFRGTATGDILFSGQVNNPNYSGSLELNNFGLTIDYLGVDYLFNGKPNIFLNGELKGLGSISVDNIEFEETKDEDKTRTKGIVYGSILNNAFKTWYLELAFENIEKTKNVEKGLLLLNTNSNQNELFNGKIYAQGTISVSGEVDKLNISVENGRVLKKSKFFLNANATSTAKSGGFTFIKFINNTDSTKVVSKEKAFGLSMDLKLQIEDGASAKLVLDGKNDSFLSANCQSDNLRFEMSHKGEIRLNGVLETNNGIYKFGLTPGISREFRIVNSTISWEGDPLNPVLDVTALYRKNVSNVGQFLNLNYKPTIETDIIINLTKNLQAPEVNFSIVAPYANSEVREGLLQKLNNRDVIFAQASSILVLNQFSTEDATFASSASSNGLNIVLKQMMNFLNTISPDFQLEAEIVTSTNTAISDKLLVNNAINLSNKFTLRNIFGIPIGKNTTSNDAVTFNISVEYDISKRNDKSNVLRAFSRPSSFGTDDFEESQVNQIYGVGIVWRYSFDNLFGSKKQKPVVIIDTITSKKDTILIKKDTIN